MRGADEFVPLTREPPNAANGLADTVWRDVIAKHPELKEWIVGHESLPAHVLAELSSDADPRVRASVAVQAHCPPEVLATLARDAEPGVRAAVAFHPQLSADLRDLLAQDPNEWVQSTLGRRQIVFEPLSDNQLPELRGDGP